MTPNPGLLFDDLDGPMCFSKRISLGTVQVENRKSGSLPLCRSTGQPRDSGTDGFHHMVEDRGYYGCPSTCEGAVPTLKSNHGFKLSFSGGFVCAPKDFFHPRQLHSSCVQGQRMANTLSRSRLWAQLQVITSEPDCWFFKNRRTKFE